MAFSTIVTSIFGCSLRVRPAQCAGEWAGSSTSRLKSRRKEGGQNPKIFRHVLERLSVSKYANLIPALDAIEASSFWLKISKPGWSISRPAVERFKTGEYTPIFVLYQGSVPIILGDKVKCEL